MKHRRSWALALALTLPFAACDDSTGTGQPGSMSVMLTDAPGDFLQAVVEIERVELVGDEDGVTVLMDDPFTTDLLTLSNDVASLAEDVVIPAGTYSQLRLIIPNACIEVEGENETSTIYASSGFDACGEADGSLQLPSFDASGLKINLPEGATTVDGDAHIVLLDFDVSESFGQQAGNSGMWVMHPVIHATELDFSSSLTVELTVADTVDLGALAASLADFEARLSTEEEAVAFTDPDEDGVYTATFLFLVPGEDLEVAVGLQEGIDFDFTLDPASPVTLDILDGESVVVEFEVTSAAEIVSG